MKGNKNKYVPVLFFLVIVLIGLFIYKDYGVSWDENTQRRTGLINALFINAKLGYAFMSEEEVDRNIQKYTVQKNFDESTLMDYRDRDYGPFFELVLIGFETVLNVHEYPEVLHLRHLINYIVFCISLFFFYLLLNARFKDYKLALLGAIILFLSPRIFAQSFYNSKDIIFMSFMIISLYSTIIFLRHKNLKSSIFHAITCAILVDTRVPGVMVIGFTLVFIFLDFLLQKDKLKFLKEYKSPIILYVVLTGGVIVAFWPFLWTDPIGNFLESFFNKSNFSRWPWKKLFLGEEIPAEGPFYYIPVLIAVTTPILYLILSIAGVFKYIKTILFKLKYLRMLWEDMSVKIDTLMLLSFIAPLLMVIVFNSALYNGWRHMFFIYPAVVYFSVVGFDYLLKEFLQTNKKFAIGFVTIVLILIISTCIKMIKIHPFEMVYFNTLAGDNVEEKFDADYWCMSYKQGLEYVLKREEGTSVVKVFNNHWPVEANAQILPKSDYERIIFVELENADYVISTPTYSKTIKIEEQLQGLKSKKAKKIHEFNLDNVHLHSVYKLEDI